MQFCCFPFAPVSVLPRSPLVCVTRHHRLSFCSLLLSSSSPFFFLLCRLRPTTRAGSVAPCLPAALLLIIPLCFVFCFFFSCLTLPFCFRFCSPLLFHSYSRCVLLLESVVGDPRERKGGEAGGSITSPFSHNLTLPLSFSLSHPHSPPWEARVSLFHL